MTATTATTATAAPRRSRKLLVPLATLVAASGIAFASGATFTTATASTGMVASGVLTQSNSNSVAFSQSNLKPGDVVTGSVTITNTGTLPAIFTITETEQVNTFGPQSDLTLQITENGTPISNTELGAAAPLTRPTFAPGEARTYVYTVTFNQAAANAQQGKVANTTYTFSSVQTDEERFENTQGGTVTTQVG